VPAVGDDEFTPELLTEVKNMYIEQVGEGIVAFVEEMFVERRAGDDFAAMQRQIFEHPVFARRQRTVFPAQVTLRAAGSIRTSRNWRQARACPALRRMSARNRARSSGKSNGLMR